VEDELQGRGEARVQVATDLRAQQSGRGLERGSRAVAFLSRAHHRVEHARVLQIARDLDIRDGHETEPRIAQPLVEALRDDDADAIRETCRSVVPSHFVPSPRVTSLSTAEVPDAAARSGRFPRPAGPRHPEPEPMSNLAARLLLELDGLDLVADLDVVEL